MGKARPTPGAHRRWCQRGKLICARRLHEEEGASLNRFGGVGCAAGRIPLAAGEQKRFCPLLGLRPKGGAARHSCSIVLNMAAPQAWERFGCQTIDSILLPDTRQASPFCRRTRSAPECLRHSRGKKFLAGYKGKPAFRGTPRNRNFSRKSCFFRLRGRG